MFHEEPVLFIIGFILVYAVIGTGILAYYGFTNNINERLDVRARMNRKNRKRSAVQQPFWYLLNRRTIDLD